MEKAIACQIVDDAHETDNDYAYIALIASKYCEREEQDFSDDATTYFFSDGSSIRWAGNQIEVRG
jgi:hypothetical protein